TSVGSASEAPAAAVSVVSPALAVAVRAEQAVLVRPRAAAEPLLLRSPIAAGLPGPAQRRSAAEPRVQARRPVADSADSAAALLLSPSHSAVTARSSSTPGRPRFAAEPRSG